MKTLNQAKILVVDDEPDLRSMLVFEFELHGCQVLSAPDGTVAFEILQAEHVDAVVTDVKMQNGTGVDLLHRIREKHTCEPLVVFITAYDTVLTPLEAYDQGAEGIFGKPFHLQALTDRVERLLQPPAVRWAEQPNQEYGLALKLRLPDLATARAQQRLDLGRGGFALDLQDTPAPEGLGDRIGFDISFDSGPVSRMTGNGTVQWTIKNAKGKPTACGVEFESLSDQTRLGVLEWLEANPCCAYIPRLLHRAGRSAGSGFPANP